MREIVEKHKSKAGKPGKAKSKTKSKAKKSKSPSTETSPLQAQLVESDGASEAMSVDLLSFGSTITDKSHGSPGVNDNDDDEVPPPLTVVKHREKDGDIQLYCKYYSDPDLQPSWNFLFDMWCDYPDDVRAYRNEHKLTRRKKWKDPKFSEVEEVKRILDHDGDLKKRTATFTIVWDNGWRSEDVSYDNLEADAEELLAEYLAYFP